MFTVICTDEDLPVHLHIVTTPHTNTHINGTVANVTRDSISYRIKP